MTATAARRIRLRLRSVAWPLAAFAIWRLGVFVLVRVVGGSPTNVTVAWDGSWYLQILDHGYAPTTGQQPTAFFPLLPWLTWAARWLTGGSTGVAIGLVTLLGGAAATTGVFLVVQSVRNTRVARFSIVALLLFPTSIFLSMFYGSALLVAFTAAAILAYRSRHHVWGAVFCAGATLAHSTGILIVAVMVAVVLLEGGELANRLKTAAVYALAGLAVIPVVVASWVQAGDPTSFLSAQRQWGRTLALPGRNLMTAAGWLAGQGVNQYAAFEVILDILAVAIGVGAVIWMFRNKWPRELPLWTLAVLVPVVFSSTVMSMDRYLITAWPVFAVAGQLASRMKTPVVVTVAAVEFALLVLAARILAVGVFLG